MAPKRRLMKISCKNDSKTQARHNLKRQRYTTGGVQKNRVRDRGLSFINDFSKIRQTEN